MEIQGVGYDIGLHIQFRSLTTGVKEMARNKFNWKCVQEVKWKRRELEEQRIVLFVGKEMKIIN
jgi:hypothetical protein